MKTKETDTGVATKTVKACVVAWTGIDTSWMKCPEELLCNVVMVHDNGAFIITASPDTDYELYAIPKAQLTQPKAHADIASLRVDEWDKPEILSGIIYDIEQLLAYEDPELKVYSAYGGSEGVVITFPKAVKNEHILGLIKQSYVLMSL